MKTLRGSFATSNRNPMIAVGERGSSTSLAAASSTARPQAITVERMEEGGPPRETVADAPDHPRPVRHVVLDAAGLSGIDASAVDAVAEVHAGCTARNITLEIARATSELRERFDATGLTELLGPEHFHPTVVAAIGTGQQ